MYRRITLVYVYLIVLTCIYLLLLIMPTHSKAVNGYGILSLSNAERSSNGIAALSYNSSLAQAAQLRAQDIIENQYWSHTSPTGRTMGSFLGSVGYPVYAAGENLSRGYDADGDVVSAWMASSAHRTTILSADYNEIGVGYANGLLDGDYTTVVVAYYAATGPVYVPEPVPVVEAASSPAPATPQPEISSTPTESYNTEPLAVEIVAEAQPVAPAPQSATITLTATVPEHEIASPPLDELVIEQVPLPGTAQHSRSFWDSVLDLMKYFELFYVIKHASLLLS